jgi:hypothetical protein
LFYFSWILNALTASRLPFSVNLPHKAASVMSAGAFFWSLPNVANLGDKTLNMPRLRLYLMAGMP